MRLSDTGAKETVLSLLRAGHSQSGISKELCIPISTLNDFLRKWSWKEWWEEKEKLMQPDDQSAKLLLLDIETAPILGNVWGLFNCDVGLNQIERDWYILSWSAKWLHEDEVMYQDKSESWDDEEDGPLLEEIHSLMNEADFIIAHNGKRFDAKKLNARFIINGYKPPSNYKVIDTCIEARKHFGFTSNKLEYLTDRLCTRYKKLKHGKFPGFLLWKECLRGNQEAWAEMEEYNINDVLSLEELYINLLPWMRGHPSLDVWREDLMNVCACGSDCFVRNGYYFTNLSKFDKFTCEACGAEKRGRVNLLPKEKRDSLLTNLV